MSAEPWCKRLRVNPSPKRGGAHNSYDLETFGGMCARGGEKVQTLWATDATRDCSPRFHE